MLITEQSAVELFGMMERREVTSLEVTSAYLNRIEKKNPELRAFVRFDRDGALQTAEAIDARRAQGEAVGPLAGLPVAIKDLLCSTESVTSCGSKMLANYVSPYDATVVSRLKQAGAVLVGKTNMDEFAMGGSTETSAFEPTRNPWNTQRIPGGSSGGAAACVAASLAPLSLGSDTGGSIRQPAAHCGVVGLKPTYGRVSRYGLVAFGSSLDCIGPLARSAEDVALLLSVIAGKDERDATTIDSAVPNYRTECESTCDGLRLGIIDEHLGEGTHPEVNERVTAAIEVYKALGATVHPISLPHSRYAIAAYYIIAPSEASSNLARYDGAQYGFRASELSQEGDQGSLEFMYRKTRQAGFGAEVKRRIMLGTYALSAGYYDAYYLKALRVRRLIAEDFARAFENVDLLIGPVTPTPAFRIGEKIEDPLAMYMIDSCTVGANLAGLPAISLPCGFSQEGLPIGVQLQGPALAESRLLTAAVAFQQQTDWHQRRPEE